MLKVIIEQPNSLGHRFLEVKEYYETTGKNDTINTIAADFARWFTKPQGYKTGHGGSHVWVSDLNGKRLLFVMEY